MKALEILATDDLRAVAFKVCTALDRIGTRAVLTGGSAATVYAPQAYQSRDVDFIAYQVKDAATFLQAISTLGFVEDGRIYSHSKVPVTVDFPGEDIKIGSDVVERYDTLRENDLLLHILTPTDCVRDRLASFYWYQDRSALLAACGVVKARSTEIKLGEVRDWSEREGEEEKYEEFLDRLSRYG